MTTTRDDEIDQAQVVDLIRSITRDQPDFMLDMPSLLVLCGLEYQWRGVPLGTALEDGTVQATLDQQSEATRIEYQERAKRAVMRAICAGQVGVMSTGRVGLFDCRDPLPPKALAH
jgi:hypothetical protein